MAKIASTGRYLSVATDTEAEAVKQLERDIEVIADKTPSWLWDIVGLAYVYDAIDTALAEYERRNR